MKYFGGKRLGAVSADHIAQERRIRRRMAAGNGRLKIHDELRC
jgi:hypothetical protein